MTEPRIIRKASPAKKYIRIYKLQYISLIQKLNNLRFYCMRANTHVIIGNFCRHFVCFQSDISHGFARQITEVKELGSTDQITFTFNNRP